MTNKGKIVVYNYISEPLAMEMEEKIDGISVKEDLSRRTNTTAYFRSNGKEKMVSFSGLPFLKVNGSWHTIETATATISDFSSSTGIIVKKKGFNDWLLSLLGEEAKADTYSAYSGAGDGYAELASQSTWAAARDATTGTVGSTGTQDGEAGSSRAAGGGYGNYKSFFPFKVAYPSDATGLSCLISLYINGGNNTVTDSYDYAAFTYGNPDATSTLTGTDINNFTDTAYTASTSQDTLIANVGQNTFSLNTAGMAALTNNAWNEYAWRGGNDIKNQAIGTLGKNQIVYADTSEYAGTDHDPFISCTYSLPAGASSLDSEMILFQ